jgi:hypothetical protein
LISCSALTWLLDSEFPLYSSGLGTTSNSWCPVLILVRLCFDLFESSLAIREKKLGNCCVDLMPTSDLEVMGPGLVRT